MIIPKLILILICFIAIIIYTMAGASAVNTTDQTSGYNPTDIQNNPDTANFDNNVSKSSKTFIKQSSSTETASIHITNEFRDAYSKGFPNPGNLTNHSNYCNWVWTTINITNNGPNDTNVTIENIESKGFIYYNPTIGWNGYVRFNNGSGWTWDNNFNVTTGLGTYDIANGDTYQVAILGYINHTGNITNTVNEIYQDVYSPDPYPSANSTLNVPKAAIIRLNETFRKSLNGSAIHNLNYLDWVYSISTTTNNGPDTTNVKYQDISSGFTSNGNYAVSKDGGLTWVWQDGSYNLATGIWSINLSSNACYLLAIYGQITKYGEISNTMTEISQDVYNPYGPDNMAPKCLIVFDDGNSAQYDIAFKYMQSKGIVGTTYVNGYNIGQNGVLTISNLIEMDAAGWIIANHTYDHATLTQVSEQEIYNEISEQINFLIRNGLNKGAYDLAYPGGYSNENVYIIMNELGIQTGRTTLGNPIENFNGLNLYQIPAYTLINTTSVSSVEGYIDNAMASDSTIVILFHNIVNSNPNEYEYLTSDFKKIIDYVAKSGINCININDLYQESATAPINIPTIGSEFNNLSKSNGYANATVFIKPEADIQINNTYNYVPNYHNNITLTVRVTNNGPNTAENVTAGDWLDGSYLRWVSDDSNGSYNPDIGVWTIGSLKSGETVILNLIVNIIAFNKTIINAVTYNSGSTYDPNPYNNYQTINFTIPIPPKADIQINNTVSNYNVNYHDNITLTITVTNKGPNTAEDVTVLDLFNGSYLRWVSDDSNGSYNPDIGVWTIGSLKSGESSILNLIANVLTSNKIITNTATYNSGSTYDPNPNNNNQTVNITVLITPTGITINPITGFKGDNINLIANLTDTHNNIPLANKNIQFTINGTLIGTATTNNQGTATLPYTINLNNGTYNILAQFTADTNYTASNNTNNLTVVLRPTASVDQLGGIYNTNKTVILSMNKPGTIYYTTNGTNPTTSSSVYSKPLSISTTTVLKYLAVDLAGNKSPIYTQSYTIDKVVPTASANPTGGLYNTTKSVTLTMSEPGTIYYTTNGTTPTTTSTKYSGPITISSTTTLKFLAIDTAGNKSPIYTQIYTIDKIPPTAMLILQVDCITLLKLLLCL